jgi:Na+-driven multidrug efflux pump
MSDPAVKDQSMSMQDADRLVMSTSAVSAIASPVQIAVGVEIPTDDDAIKTTLIQRIVAAPPEMLMVVKLGWQQSLAYFVQMFQVTAMLLAVSTYGGDEAVSGVANGFAVVMTFIVFNIGFTAPLDALIPQEFGRDPSSVRMGYYLKVVMLEMTVCTCICAGLCTFVVPPLLIKLFDNPVLAANVTRFVVAAPFYTLFWSFAQALAKYAMNQQQPFIPGCAAVCASALSVPTFFGVLKIAPKEHLIEISALTLGLVLAVQVTIASALILRNPQTRRTLGGWSLSLDWNEYILPTLKLALPSIPLCGGEMAAFNIFSLMAAVLPPDQDEAFVIMWNLAILAFAVTYGATGATGALLGEAIGVKDVAKARRIVVAGHLTVGGLTAMNSIFFALFNKQLLSAYTSDAAALSWAPLLIIPFACLHMLDCLQYCTMQIYCAVGKNDVGAAICLGGLFGVAISHHVRRTQVGPRDCRRLRSHVELRSRGAVRDIRHHAEVRRQHRKNRPRRWCRRC